MNNKQPIESSYLCPKCGYKAVKMENLTECPLCKTCTGCGQPVRNCTCIDSE